MAEAERTPSQPLTVRWFGSSKRNRTEKTTRTPFRRQFTPFVKTPGSRRLGLSRSVQKRITRSPQKPKEPEEDLLRTTWRMFKSTPLHHFSYSKRDLRRYATQLSSYVESQIKKGLAVAIDEIPNTAFIKPYTGLKVKAEDKEAVQIILKRKSPKDGSMQPIVTALLVCTDMEEEIAQTVDRAFIALPLLMVKGPVTLSHLIISWLETQFDCSISSLVFPPISLHWMVAMWAGHEPDLHPKPVELCYMLPDEIEGLRTITMTINNQDCKRLWDSIHPAGDRFLENEAQQFIKALEAHFYHVFRIDLSAMRLKRVGTPIAYVSSEGRIKIFSEDHLPNVLAHLTELAAEYTLIC